MFSKRKKKDELAARQAQRRATGMQSPEKQSLFNKLLIDLLLPLLDLPPLLQAQPKIKLPMGDKIIQVVSDALGKHVKPLKQTI